MTSGSLWWSVLAVLALVSAAGCRCQRDDAGPEGDVGAASAESSAGANSPHVALPPKKILYPLGPPMAIQRGLGVGAIVFGATLATVERHMGLPCPELVGSVCYYVSRGVKFEFEDGLLHGIVVYRGGRPVLHRKQKDADDVYNIFNGAILPDVIPGMVPEAVQEAVGEPRRVEKVADDGWLHLVERHFYDDLVLEYDYNPVTKKLMLGAIQLLAPKRLPGASPSRGVSPSPSRGVSPSP